MTALASEQQARTSERAAGAWRDVVRSLENDIIFGRLPPDHHLIEDEVMAAAGASRHAVRRAFDELDRTGLVVRLPNRGARVRNYTAEEVQNLYEIRETLETKAALRMRLPAPVRLIRTLESIQRRHDAALAKRDVDALFKSNNEFHDTLFLASGNDVLAQAIRVYSWQTHPIRMRFVLQGGWHGRAAEQHRDMIRLLSTSDNHALAHACYDHLQPSKRLFLTATTET